MLTYPPLDILLPYKNFSLITSVDASSATRGFVQDATRFYTISGSNFLRWSTTAPIRNLSAAVPTSNAINCGCAGANGRLHLFLTTTKNIYSDDNGDTWTTLTSAVLPTAQAAVFYFNGILVLFDSGSVYNSINNGLTWTLNGHAFSGTTTSTTDCGKIIGNTLYRVASGGAIQYTLDGLNWINVAPVAALGNLVTINFFDGKFFVGNTVSTVFEADNINGPWTASNFVVDNLSGATTTNYQIRTSFVDQENGILYIAGNSLAFGFRRAGNTKFFPVTIASNPSDPVVNIFKHNGIVYATGSGVFRNLTI